MSKNDSEGKLTRWSLNVVLPQSDKAKHEFKFIVNDTLLFDGKWIINEKLPRVTDILGNVNNVLINENVLNKDLVQVTVQPKDQQITVKP